MKKIFLRRIYHRGAWCIGICFDYDKVIWEQVRHMTGIVYSNTNRCFYVDDTEDNIKLIIKTLRGNVEIDISALYGSGIPPGMPVAGLSGSGENGSEPESGAVDVDSMSPEDEDTDPVMGVDRYNTALDPKKEPATIEKEYIHKYNKPFYNRELQNEAGDKGKSRSSGGYGAVEFRTGLEKGTLIIRFTGRYDPEWISEIKSYGRCYYDRNRREWVLGWSQVKCDSLADYFAGRGFKVNVVKYRVSQAGGIQLRVYIGFSSERYGRQG